MATGFTKIIPASSLQGSGLVLPADFRDAAVPETGAYTLQNGEGKQWQATITRKQQGAHERADITGGWRAFAADNGIQAGDEIRVQDKGGRVIEVTKTGRTGTPRAARTPKSAKPKAAASARKSTGGKASGSKTPAAAGGVKKPRGGGSTGKKRQAAAAAAAAVAAEPEPGDAPMEEAEAPAGPLPEYVPPAPEYLQPIWPKWCAIM